MFSPHNRPIQPSKNRRVIRIVEANPPVARNHRLIDLRRDSLNEVVAQLFFAIFAGGLGTGFLASAFRIAERTPGNVPEMILGLSGLVFIGVAIHCMRAALRSWKACDSYDERLMRREEALATVIRPIERKLPVPFHDWMQ